MVKFKILDKQGKEEDCLHTSAARKQFSRISMISSNEDNSLAATKDKMYIKNISFILFSSLPGVLTPVRGESLKIMDLMSLYQQPLFSMIHLSQELTHLEVMRIV